MRTMTDDETKDYIKEIEKFTKKISRSKKLAMKFAIKTGIWDKDGNLTEHYK